MPLCPDCSERVLTDIRGRDTFQEWKHRRGDVWDYNEAGTPYWLYCWKCHLGLMTGAPGKAQNVQPRGLAPQAPAGLAR